MFSIIFAIILAIMPPCQAEDATQCGWNADTQGNGSGHSFIALNGGVTIYADGTIITF